MENSNNSMLALVKQLSNKSLHEQITCTIQEYDDLVRELFDIDKHLQDKYMHPSCVPRIYSLYGVKITIS